MLPLWLHSGPPGFGTLPHDATHSKPCLHLNAFTESQQACSFYEGPHFASITPRGLQAPSLLLMSPDLSQRTSSQAVAALRSNPAGGDAESSFCRLISLSLSVLSRAKRLLINLLCLDEVAADAACRARII